MVKIALIGLGAWGKNLARSFSQIRDVHISSLCDIEKSRLEEVKQLYPKARITTDYNEALMDEDVQGVIIASPSPLHYRHTKEALLHGKDVFVEKLLAFSFHEAKELSEISIKNKCTLMVGHIMEYHPAVIKLKEIIKEGLLGKIYYISSQRMNLGRIRKDENVLWSFGAHDISVILYLLEEEPYEVSAQGECFIQDGIEDLVFLNMHFMDKKMAQLQVSWLDPHKARKTTIVGDKKMAIFDDIEATEKIRIYDKGVLKTYSSYGELISLRFGDVFIPNIDVSEPLKIECEHFINCLRYNKRPKTDSISGIRVVKVLEAAQKSLKQNGIPVKI